MKDSVEIINHSKKPIKIVEHNKSDPLTTINHIVLPKESFVFFTDKVDSLKWERE